MKGIFRIAVLIAMLAAPAAILIWWLSRDDPLEETRYQLRETEVLVSSLYESHPRLYKAGRYLQDTLSVRAFDGRSAWLQPGNYFLSTDDDRGQYSFPIPLTGYRCGPDKDGSFNITIRPPLRDNPPASLSGMLPFKYIPSGNFLLGDRINPSEPHYVWLTGYFISPFEISNEQFREFMMAPDGYTNDENWTREGRVWKYSARSKATALLKTGDPDYKRFGQPDQPVTWVNWFEASAFCKWLTGKLGSRRWLCSLPTDAEWEKAARGPDNLDFSLSMTISDSENPFYNWKKNPNSTVTVVGIRDSERLYRPNRYGLFHMTGNVAEWTQSTDRPYNRQHPYAEDERNHDDTHGLRTVRGGSWYSASTAYLYIPYRDAFQPEHSTQDTGFRVVVRPLP